MSSRATSPDVERMIRILGLTPHPEGGFFRETFRSALSVGGGASRSASTAIYFLLPAGACSAFHVIGAADEIWHHYGGDAVELHTITPAGDHGIAVLGNRLEEGERPQLLVPAGTLQAAFARGPRAALCGCTVTPGFDFSDFALPARDELLARFPRHREVIARLTR